MSTPKKQDMIHEEDQSKKMEEEKPLPKENKVESNPTQIIGALFIAEKTSQAKNDKTNVTIATNVIVAKSADQTQQQLTKVYNYGSNEMDQFWLPDQRSETRRPYINSVLNNIVVVQIACGSLHTLILTNQGLVFSQGQNDDGALGRPDETQKDEDSDKISKLVDIPIKVDMISAGDSHSVAANSELGICFQWGTYRNTEKSNLIPPARSPIRVGAKELHRKKFAKILSGYQHSLILTEDGDLYGWGDPDMGVVGRMPKTRHGYEQALKIAKITQHKVSDIYTGGRHSFLKRLIKKHIPATDDAPEQKAVYAYYSWGLNNFGQLGLDLPEEKHQDVVFEPTQMKFFENLDVKEFCGGESHSLALLEDGTVYGFGRNEFGQFGIGKLKDNHPVHGEIQEKNPKPLKIDTFPADSKKITNIWAGSSYSYAKDESGQCYSWGFGSNFVLGNRKDIDEDEYKPYVIPRDFFKNEIPFDFSLGTQHVTYYVNLAEDGQQHSVSKELLLEAPDEYLPLNMRKKTQLTALAKAQAQAEKEERAAKKADEVSQKKKTEDEKKVQQVKEKNVKKEEKVDVGKKREKSGAKKESEKHNDNKKTTDVKKKVEQKRSTSTSKKNGKEEKSKSRSKSKPPTKATNKSKSQSKERAPKEDGKKQTQTVKSSAKNNTQSKPNGSSNKIKPAKEDEALVSKSKNVKQLKKETTTKKK